MKTFIVIAVLCGLAMAKVVPDDIIPPPVGPEMPESLPLEGFGEDGDMKIINENDEAIYGDCHDVKNAGYNKNGTYQISLNGTKVLAPCMFANGFVYLIILGRIDGSVSFYRGMAAYEKPFGNALGNFWFGLDNMHYMTQAQHNHILDVHVWDWSDLYSTATYTSFYVNAATLGYRLDIGGYRRGVSGRLSNALGYNNGQRFHTYDNPGHHNCAKVMHGGWWYGNCTAALPTGKYYVGGFYKKRGQYDGIFWSHYFKADPYGYSMKRMFLTIRKPI